MQGLLKCIAPDLLCLSLSWTMCADVLVMLVQFRNLGSENVSRKIWGLYTELQTATCIVLLPPAPLGLSENRFDWLHGNRQSWCFRKLGKGFFRMQLLTRNSSNISSLYSLGLGSSFVRKTLFGCLCYYAGLPNLRFVCRHEVVRENFLCSTM